ncbi:tetratricopeptide repeat protein [Lysinibacillus sp. UGB7]|uniref:tetratricopeptide repeat protein n=1 Tax=Lysinibacillus sp. UGB7 TaxID=3411039 RepID=UPI003B7C396D
MDTYFSKKNTGGSYASKGFEYQDYCCLSTVFMNLSENDFKSVSVETINDFTIMFETYEVCVQVKRQHINISYAKTLLEGIEIKKDKMYEIIGTSISEDLRNLMTNIMWLKNIKNSSRNDSEKIDAEESLKKILEKQKLEKYYEKLLITSFAPIPEDMAPMALYANYSYWLDTNSYSCNKEDLLNNMLLKISKMRSDRAYLNKEDLEATINQYRIETAVTKVLDEFYDRKFKTPSEILKILGGDKEEILKKLEVHIIEADKYIKSKDFSKALKIYSSLAVLYQEEAVLINCAMLYEVLDNYSEAISYCNKILQLNPRSYEAYFILGTSSGQLNQIDNALEYLNKAKELKETAEIYYNLGFIYYLRKDNDKAYSCYRKCLELDDTFADAHLNISDFTEKENAIFHLDRAIELNSHMYQAYGKKGELLRDIGLHNHAIRYFKKCLDYDKTNFQALKGISLCLLDLGKPEEAAIYFADWISEYKEQLLPSKMNNGQSNMIVDITWHRTRFLHYKKIDENIIRVDMPYGSVEINISEGKCFIFIGCLMNLDKSEAVLPIVGKLYENEKEFLKCVTSIKNNSILPNDNATMAKSIKVLVREYNDRIFISIDVGNYQMSGFTDMISDGYRNFLNGYNSKKEIGVLISCLDSKKDFLIEGIINVTLEKFEEEPLKKLKNDITKEMLNKAMESDSNN